MKVSHFNTFPYGGAATAATRIQQPLNHLGVDSRFCYYRNEKDETLDNSFQQVEFVPPQSGGFFQTLQRRKQKIRQREIYRQFNEHLATRPSGAETFSMAELPEPTVLDWPAIDADILHLHWLSFFADYPTFFDSIPSNVPVVWTLHDMNAFTGGCHYSNDCHQYRFGCGDCRQVVKPNPQDVSRISFRAKQKALATKTIHVVTPSKWLNELAQRSPIWPDSTTFQTIKYGLDLQKFQPLDKQAARQKLGIKSNAVLVGFGADDVNNQRKGIQHLLGAFRQIQSNFKNQTPVSTSRIELKFQSEIEVLLFGAGQIQDQSGLPRLHQMGYIDSIEKQQLIYSAADIVVVPSREDNQPQVGLEAMACGTPVVGFNAGGIPEYVRHEETGLLAEIGNETQLAERIVWLANHPLERIQMGQRARRMMESEFESIQQSNKYIRLYQSALQSGTACRAA